MEALSYDLEVSGYRQNLWCHCLKESFNSFVMMLTLERVGFCRIKIRSSSRSPAWRVIVVGVLNMDYTWPGISILYGRHRYISRNNSTSITRLTFFNYSIFQVYTRDVKRLAGSSCLIKNIKYCLELFLLVRLCKHVHNLVYWTEI